MYGYLFFLILIESIKPKGETKRLSRAKWDMCANTLRSHIPATIFGCIGLSYVFRPTTPLRFYSNQNPSYLNPGVWYGRATFKRTLGKDWHHYSADTILQCTCFFFLHFTIAMCKLFSSISQLLFSLLKHPTNCWLVRPRQDRVVKVTYNNKKLEFEILFKTPL